MHFDLMDRKNYCESLMFKDLPSLNALKVFEAVARRGSFTVAAQELCLSQSAVSHQIRLLEEQLGF